MKIPPLITIAGHQIKIVTKEKLEADLENILVRAEEKK